MPGEHQIQGNLHEKDILRIERRKMEQFEHVREFARFSPDSFVVETTADIQQFPDQHRFIANGMCVRIERQIIEECTWIRKQSRAR